MKYLQMVIQVNMDCHRRVVAISQKQIAQEICMESEVKIGLNQSMVSKMYIGIDVPKCNNTIDAINSWIEKKENNL
ncbi:18011_t:CDS:2 [Entrophospora sp. SA101]|nr:18011_t:CDS:2 [Entrophospora sp. SA101]